MAVPFAWRTKFPVFVGPLRSLHITNYDAVVVDASGKGVEAKSKLRELGGKAALNGEQGQRK